MHSTCVARSRVEFQATFCLASLSVAEPKLKTILKQIATTSGLYYKNILTIISDDFK
jgi:hypothetical protein